MSVIPSVIFCCSNEQCHDIVKYFVGCHRLSCRGFLFWLYAFVKSQRSAKREICCNMKSSKKSRFNKIVVQGKGSFTIVTLCNLVLLPLLLLPYVI